MKPPPALVTLTGLLTATFITTAAPTPQYAAHEWGTFTSVQGSDGELIRWNPFTQTDLPKFVHTRQHPCPLTAEQQRARGFGGLLTKNSNLWLQRMETPVIYFHAREDFTVNVSVQFPQGLITEWYPAASAFGPASGLAPLLTDRERSHLDWNQLQVLGRSRTGTRIPAATDPSHYFTARTEEASPVRVQRGLHPSQDGQAERFLFYRGAGDFVSPLHASLDAAGDLVLANRGAHPLGPLFVFRQVDGRAGLARIQGLAAGHRHTVAIGALQTAEAVTPVRDALARELHAALAEAGLSVEESAAMVNTWRNDWLGDRGLRVLYLLPQSWTDATLPLKLEPAPEELVRVMVGRAEILEPALEQQLQLALQAQLEGRTTRLADTRNHALEPRFLEAALSRVAQLEIAARTMVQPPARDEATRTERARRLATQVHEAANALRAQWLAATAPDPAPAPRSRRVALTQKVIGETRQTR